MSAIFNALMCGLTLLLLGARLVSLDHAIMGSFLLFAGFELAAFGIFAIWFDRGWTAARRAMRHP